MFQKVVLSAIIILLSVSQVAILPQFFPAGIVPNLVLIVVVYWTIRSGFSENWKKIILAGLFLDLAYGWAIGINILSLSVVSFAVGYLAKRFSMTQKGWGFAMAIGLVGFGALVNDAVINLLIRSVGWLKNMPLESSMIYPFGMKIIWNAFLTAGCFVFLRLPLAKMEKFFDSYRNSRFVKTRFLK